MSIGELLWSNLYISCTLAHMFYWIEIWYIAAMTNYDVKCLGYEELLMIYFVFTWLDWTVDSASARRHAWPWEVSKSCSHFVGSACEDWPTAEDWKLDTGRSGNQCTWVIDWCEYIVLILELYNTETCNGLRCLNKPLVYSWGNAIVPVAARKFYV